MREGAKKFFQSFKLGRRPRRSFYETVSKSLGFSSKGIGGRELGFDYGLKDSPVLVLGKFFPMSRGALSSASPALCRGRGLDFESACLAKGGRFSYDWVDDPKGGCMSVKGDFKFRALGYVYFKQWYTGLKCRALESKAYFYKSNGGIMVMADKKDVQFDWEGGLN